MKRLFFTISLLLLVPACTDNKPVDPEKPSKTEFTVSGKTMCNGKPCITVKTKMKPGARLSAEQAESAVQTAIGILER